MSFSVIFPDPTASVAAVASLLGFPVHMKLQRSRTQANCAKDADGKITARSLLKNFQMRREKVRKCAAVWKFTSQGKHLKPAPFPVPKCELRSDVMQSEKIFFFDLHFSVQFIEMPKNVLTLPMKSLALPISADTDTVLSTQSRLFKILSLWRGGVGWAGAGHHPFAHRVTDRMEISTLLLYSTVLNIDHTIPGLHGTIQYALITHEK